MTISSISDLLALSWTHAYCTEGPEFVAALGGGSGGLVVGTMSLTAPVAAYVSTWPDEIATEDLVAGPGGTPSGGVFDAFANTPIYNPASSDFNGKPAVECTQNPLSATSAGVRYMSIAAASYPDIAQPFEWVIVAKPRSFVGASSFLAETSAGGGSADICRFSFGSASNWRLAFQSSSLQGGTADTNLHLFRVVAGGTDQLYIDETLVLSGNAGSNSQKGLQIGRDPGASEGEKDYAFIGIKSGSLTAGERSDIYAFAQGHWGVA